MTDERQARVLERYRGYVDSGQHGMAQALAEWAGAGEYLPENDDFDSWMTGEEDDEAWQHGDELGEEYQRY